VSRLQRSERAKVLTTILSGLALERLIHKRAQLQNVSVYISYSLHIYALVRADPKVIEAYLLHMRMVLIQICGIQVVCHHLSLHDVDD
jgi:hypothetical protein